MNTGGIMTIIKLILHKYKRFMFINNITTLVYTPETNTQIILGSNGCGKSSLLSMLNPLPADKKDFDTDGYKQIIIKYNNKLYDISSGLVPNKHSFKVDNVELNTSGTRTVQLELVLEHFNITPYSNSIMLGNIKLTTMLPIDRKKLFTDIANVDYTFALRVYNNLKKRHRDIDGSIRVLKDNLLSLEKSVISKTELDRYLTDIRYIEELKSYLTSQYTSNVEYTDIEIINNKISQLSANNKQFTWYSDKILELDVNTKLSSEVEEEIAIVKYKISVIDKLITDIQHKITTETIQHHVDTDDISADITKLEERLSIITGICDSFLITDLTNIDKFITEYEASIMTILDILNNIKILNNNIAVDDNKNTIEELRLHIFDINNIIIGTNSKLSTYNSELISLEDSLKNNNHIVCGNCGHSWVDGYDDKKYTQIKLDIDNLTNKNDAYKVKLSKLELSLDMLISLQNEILNLKNYIISFEYLRPILNTIEQNTTIDSKSTKIDVSTVVNTLTSLTSNLSVLKDYTSVSFELSKLYKHREEQKLIHNIEYNVKLGNIKVLETELNSNIMDKAVLTERLSNLETILKYQRKLSEIKTSIKYGLISINKLKYNSMLYNKNIAITKHINILKELHMNIEVIVNGQRDIHSKISLITSQLSDLLEREKVIKDMMIALSPTEGLIAKSINSFLVVFLNDMNKIINSVWSYPIEILPYSTNELEELDYKFPVIVNGNEPNDDVSKLSSSMMDIVDLAFKLTYMKYTRQQHCPLFLDEFGKTFDAYHRTVSYDVIDKIISNDVNQIFIVSHYDEGYLRFGDSDISIINTNNIDTEIIKKYNAVMYME